MCKCETTAEKLHALRIPGLVKVTAYTQMHNLYVLLFTYYQGPVAQSV